MGADDGKGGGLMRNLGRFFGHIVRGAKSDPQAERRVVRDDTEEERGVDASGRTVVLRRRTIEEVEVREGG